MILKRFFVALLAAAICFTSNAAVNGQETKEDKQAEKKSDQPDKTDQDEDKKDDEEKEEETARSLFRDAITAARGGDMEKGLELMEKACKLEPENLQLQFTHISMMQSHAMQLSEEDREAANPFFYRSAKLARKLLKSDIPEGARERLASILYNEACALCVEGKTEKAMSVLAEAYENGMMDTEMPANDEDFKALHDNEEFKAFLKKQTVVIAERIAKATAEELEAFESYDFDFELKDLEGETISLGAFEDKVLIVDFWGTWCPPCREEIPSFIKLKNEYGKRGLEIVGLNYEREEDEEKVVEMIKKFHEKHEMNYMCLIGDEDVRKQVPNFRGYPTTLFIDRSGKVRLQMVGLHPYAKLESVVKALMEEKSE